MYISDYTYVRTSITEKLFSLAAAFWSKSGDFFGHAPRVQLHVQGALNNLFLREGRGLIAIKTTLLSDIYSAEIGNYCIIIRAVVTQGFPR